MTTENKIHTPPQPDTAPRVGYHPEIETAIDAVCAVAPAVDLSPFHRATLRLLGMLAKHRPETHALAVEKAQRWERLRLAADAIRESEYEGAFRVSEAEEPLFEELRVALLACAEGDEQPEGGA